MLTFFVTYRPWSVGFLSNFEFSVKGIMRNFLRLRRNRDFEYKPRFYKGEGNPYKIEHKLDKFRTTAHQQRGLKNKFSNAFDDLRNEGDKHMKTRFFVALVVLILIFLYIIDFDLSIFFSA